MLNGSYQGIGIEIAQFSDGNIYIIAVITGSPASKAGLMAGDIIKGIDDIDTKNYTSSDYGNYIAHSNKDEFKIKVMRNNEEKEFYVTKEKVNLESVAGQIIEQDNHRIGYIYISIFAANTAKQFESELDRLESDGIDSLIIDVRGNNGGHLTTAEKIVSLLVDDSHIIYKIKKNGKVTSYKSSGKETKDYPIVVIADHNSASAAELLVACLHDNIKATFVGTKTFGKGTVQELITLTNGDQYKITTKEWLTPKGKKVNGVGIEPDINVELNEEYYTNPSLETDNQLQAALKQLTK